MVVRESPGNVWLWDRKREGRIPCEEERAGIDGVNVAAQRVTVAFACLYLMALQPGDGQTVVPGLGQKRDPRRRRRRLWQPRVTVGLWQ